MLMNKALQITTVYLYEINSDKFVDICIDKIRPGNVHY